MEDLWIWLLISERSMDTVVLPDHDVGRASGVVENTAMVLVNVVVLHGDVREARWIAHTGTDGDPGSLCSSVPLVIENVIALNNDIGHATSRWEI